MKRIWHALLVLLGYRIAVELDMAARHERLQERIRLTVGRLHEARHERDVALWVVEDGGSVEDFFREIFEPGEFVDYGLCQHNRVAYRELRKKHGGINGRGRARSR